MKSILDRSFRYTSSNDTDLRKTFARMQVPVDLVEAHRAAVSEMADVDQLAPGGSQQRIFIRASHLRNQHRRHDAKRER